MPLPHPFSALTLRRALITAAVGTIGAIGAIGAYAEANRAPDQP